MSDPRDLTDEELAHLGNLEQYPDEADNALYLRLIAEVRRRREGQRHMVDFFYAWQFDLPQESAEKFVGILCEEDSPPEGKS